MVAVVNVEARLKHLELIQGVISRMASNSFLLKGWTITLVSGIGALAYTNSNRWLALFALLPTLCFWGLDAYFLQQERLYRRLYEECANNYVAPHPYSLSLDARRLHGSVPNWFVTVFSRTTVWLYLPLLASAVAVCVLAQFH